MVSIELKDFDYRALVYCRCLLRNVLSEQLISGCSLELIIKTCFLFWGWVGWFSQTHSFHIVLNVINYQ